MVGANLFWVRLGLGSTFGPGAFGGVNANATINQTILDVYGGVRLPIASPNLSIYGTRGRPRFRRERFAYFADASARIFAHRVARQDLG